MKRKVLEYNNIYLPVENLNMFARYSVDLDWYFLLLSTKLYLLILWKMQL